MSSSEVSVADERALRALALAYALHADRREGDRVAELFAPGAALRLTWRDDSVEPMESRGHRHISSVIRRLERFASTVHLVANHTLSVSGDDAEGVVYCVAHHLSEAGGVLTDHVMYIRYLDRYRRDAGVWRFADRQTVVEWAEERPAGG
jgi:hypothetical protein